MPAIFMKYLVLLFFLACTPAQRSHVYADFTVAGTQNKESTVMSAGLSYPVSKVWVSAGVWSDFYGNYGPYWSVVFSFQVFKNLEKSKEP